jgi:peptidyl-prolyl cis-trans isomerase C
MPTLKLNKDRIMLKPIKLTALALLGLLAAGQSYAEDKPLATVDGIAIPQARMDLLLKTVTAQGQSDTPDLRDAIRERLINIQILSQQALKEGLDKQPDALQQLEIAREDALSNAYVQNYIQKHPVTDDMLKQAYDDMKARTGTKEFKARHILVDTESEAKAIAAQLKKGAKFDKLAATKSKDMGSSKHGGELDWSVPSNFVKPFADALAALHKGQTSEPVHTQYGWHIIKLDDERDLKFPPMDDLKTQLTQSLQKQALQKQLADLREKAKVE